MNRTRAFRAATLGALAVASVCAASAVAQVPQPTCRALIQSSNDLFLASRTGSILARFTADGGPKTNAVVSPDGEYAAYMPTGSDNTLVIANADAHTITLTVPKNAETPTATLSHLEWASNGTLVAASHLSPWNAKFDFFHVRHDLLVRRPHARRLVTGQACTLWADGRDRVACISGDAVGNGITGKHWRGYYKVNIFGSSAVKVLGSVQASTGAAVVSETSPTFAIRVVSVDKGVTLDVSLLPTGSGGIEQYAPTGQAVGFPLDGVEYGFIPTLVDAKAGIVNVRIVRSEFGDRIFDSAIARFGTRVAVIERSPSGPELVLIRPHRHGRPPLSASLNLMAAVRSMYFVYNGRIGERDEDDDVRAPRAGVMVFQTSNGSSSGFGYAPVSILRSPGQDGERLQVGAISSLPSTVSANLPSATQTVPVLGWACEPAK